MLRSGTRCPWTACKNCRAFSSTSSARKWNPRSHAFNRARDVSREPQTKWNYNPDPFDGTVSPEQARYPLLTSNDLQTHSSFPTSVKMLARDFIEDSLYNPTYGYFPKQATIFDSQADDQGFIDFPALHDSAEFQDLVAKRYLDIYGNDDSTGPSRQLWHTPTELFRPHYGRAVAKCLVSEYLLRYFPYEDFIIYEIGAGNGSLAVDILDYLKLEYPDVYERTQYHIVEISHNLATRQRQVLQHRHPLATVTNESIFKWDTRQPAPCYFIALEVVDNFAHDVVRYDIQTMRPYQGLVTVSKDMDLDIIYEPVTDPLISSFLQMRQMIQQHPPIPKLLRQYPFMRRLYANMPFSSNLSPTEFVPTRLLSLLRSIRTFFPRHRLLLSDFSSLPDAIPGINAPVVQTRVQGKTIPTETFLVQPGWFDIFFPTDFERLQSMYEYILSAPLPSSSSFPDVTTKPSSGSLGLGSDFFNSYYPSNRRRPVEGSMSVTGFPAEEKISSVFTHAEFLETYADLDKTKHKNGENPLIDFYKNVKFLF